MVAPGTSADGAPAATPKLSVRDLTIGYGGTPALSGVSLEIQ